MIRRLEVGHDTVEEMSPGLLSPKIGGPFEIAGRAED